MATEQRIYKVTNGGQIHLVQATNQAQALRHIAGKMFKVEVAKTVEVVQLMTNGTKVDVATYMPEQFTLPE
jgi:hypothetical protein